jgi:hypothetical protein
MLVDVNWWIEVRLDTNYLYLNRAHPVTPAYSPVHGDYQILIIVEIATKLAYLSLQACAFLRAITYPSSDSSSIICLSIHVGHLLFALRARCPLQCIYVLFMPTTYQAMSKSCNLVTY